MKSIVGKFTWFISGTLWCCAAFAANELEGVRVWAAPESTRIVLDLSDSPEHSYFTLTKPDRLVIDFKETSTDFDFSKITNNSKLVKKVRASTAKSQTDSRLVIELNRPASPKVFSLKPTGPYGNRLVIDLADSKPKVETTTVKRPNNTLRDVVIAIDAGHGGDDPGSIGASGLYEKKVTLEMSKRVAKKINETRGMKAVLIRSGDYYVDLNKRSELARKKDADLLISIHADAFTSPQPKGASVWVLSRRRAESEIGRVLEDKEQHSNLLGGVGDIIKNTDSEQYLARTLIDMQMDLSMSESQSVANLVLKDLGRVTHLHKHAPESASFAVLKAPDIPSILVELGFMSNPQEEKLLKTSAHQEKLAKAIYQGVVGYFKTNPPEHTLLAQNNPRQHQVQRGESLSIIASQYGVSIKTLKQTNKLKSDVLQVGQKLLIPR